jgi:type II secretory pathway component PulF
MSMVKCLDNMPIFTQSCVWQIEDPPCLGGQNKRIIFYPLVLLAVALIPATFLFFFLVSKVLYLFLQPFSLIGQIDEIIRLVQIYLHFFTIIVTLLIQRTMMNSNLSQNLGLRRIHDISYQQPLMISRIVTKSGPTWWLYGPFGNP